MGYLRELPNVRYQSPLAHKNSSKDFILVKNLFRKNKLLDWLSVSGANMFNKFVVADGARPDNVAEDIYGSAELDYVVIISCGITNLRDEWPLSSKELHEYVENKYGLAGMGEIHHYETLEVRDENNRLLFFKKDIGILARSGFDFETSKRVMDLEKNEYLKIINLL